MGGRFPASRTAVLATVLLCVLTVGSCVAESFAGAGVVSRRGLLQSKVSESRVDTEHSGDEGHEGHNHEEHHGDENSASEHDPNEELSKKKTARNAKADDENKHHDDEHKNDDNGANDHKKHEDHVGENHEDHEHDADHIDDKKGGENHEDHDEEHDVNNHGDEGGHDEADHGHSAHVEWFDEDHEHHNSETSAEHLIEVFGGEGVLFPSELEVLFEELTLTCNGGEDDHGHSHGHAKSRHQHGDDKNKVVLTPARLVGEFGQEGFLDVRGFEKSCASILRCQLEDNCELMVGEVAEEEEENLDTFKVVVAAVFFVESIVGALVPLVVGQFEKFKLWLSILNCFSGGVFIATGFVHMLPHLYETETEVAGLNNYPLGTVVVVIGFMMVFFVEHIMFDVHSDEMFQTTTNRLSKDLDAGGVSRAKSESDTQQAVAERWKSMQKAVLLLAAISVHALLEALAFGLEDSKNGVLLLFASIGSHKGVAAMALSARFLRNGASKKLIMGFMAVFSLVAPIGIFCGLIATSIDPLAKVVLNGLSAGTFIYVGAYEVIADEFHYQHTKNSEKKPRSLKYFAVVTGVTVIALLQMIPHGEHA